MLREGKTLGDDEVKGYVRDNLARYKTPREIVFIDGGRVEGSPSFGPPFASYQAEIFLRGLAGETPEHPIPGRWRTSSAAPGPKTRCAPTRRRSGAGGSSHGCSGTSPSATSRVGDGGQHRVGQPAREIAAAAPGANWFQLYWPNDRELAASMLARAEKAGYGAVIVTLDTFLSGLEAA